MKASGTLKNEEDPRAQPGMAVPRTANPRAQAGVPVPQRGVREEFTTEEQRAAELTEK